MTGRKNTRESWERIAAGYDRAVTPTHLALGAEGLRLAGLRAGMRFLDVAAGSGALSIPAARLGARVLATDQCPAMLELLQARARRDGLDIETRVMDGHALELDSSSFDMAGSQFGVMLFPDMPRGMREMSRVVKHGGRVLMTVFGDMSKVEFLGFLAAAIRSVRPGFASAATEPVPLPFQLQDPERLRRELADAGLWDIQVHTTTETMEFHTGHDLWEWLVCSNPIVEALLGSLDLTEDDRATIRRALDVLVRERAGKPGNARLTSPIHIGVGTK